jgi:anaerobic magnesium-protoporphyrin IX monomethyl ester cyclase
MFSADSNTIDNVRIKFFCEQYKSCTVPVKGILMKILFVYSLDDIQSVENPMNSWTSVQFGISYISSMLKAHGRQTQLVVLGSNEWKGSIKQLRKAIEDFSPGLICFTAVYSQYAFIKKIAGLIRRQWPDKYLIIGGTHATLRPDEIIDGPFDSVCVGEGEYPVLELCGQLESQRQPSGIANLWIKSRNGSIEKNRPRDFLQDLDSLPFPDREMWKPWIKEQAGGELAVLLGRGCPYDCTYCSNHALRNVAGGKYVRMRSPENIVHEVDFLHKNFPNRSIFFEVESIALNKSWMIELCRQLTIYNSTISDTLSYACNIRISPQSIDENLFIALEKANFYRINIGLESGSERIRREVLRRNYSNENFLKVVSLARKHGIKILVFNMLGLPGESLDDHKETIRLNRLCQPDWHCTGIFYPYPGTKLYNTCIEQGLIKGTLDTQIERSQPVIESPYFSKKQIQRAHTWFDYHVYRGHKPLLKILFLVMMVKVRPNPIASLLFRKIVQLREYLRVKTAGSH